ncbi:hypothetical protein AG0111_0g2623 [Alternaria gaisen]|uniref:Uncharacterized protein n=1 Tax=Alternaria gaisen TaxID=167740 RepID=A0ACB6FXX6_9PLEO|nr:hypothetical protein AG0111_0g2623 [Alternaria gaisen]
MSATTRATATTTTSLAASGLNTKSTLSLWDTANAKLDSKSRKSFASVNVGNGRVINAVLKEAVT